MRTESDAEIYATIINNHAQDSKTDMIVKGKTNLLECENTKLKKQIMVEKTKAEQVPELRKEIKSLKTQIMALRAKLMDTVEKEQVNEVEQILKHKDKELRKLSEIFDDYKKSVIQLDHKIGTFIEERNPECCAMLKTRFKKFDLNSFETKVQKLIEFLLDSEVRAKKALTLEKRVKALNDENQTLRINENKLLKHETNLTKNVAQLKQDSNQVPDLMNKISSLEKSISNYQDLLSQSEMHNNIENSQQSSLENCERHVQNDIIACGLKAELLEKDLEIDKLKNKVSDLNKQVVKSREPKKNIGTLLNNLDSGINDCENSDSNFTMNVDVKRLMKKVEFLESSQKSVFEERDYYKLQTEKIAKQIEMFEKKCSQYETKISENKTVLRELEEKKSEIVYLELHNSEIIETNDKLRQKFRDYEENQQGEIGSRVENPNTIKLLVEKEETINKHLNTIDQYSNKNSFLKKEIDFLKSKLEESEDKAVQIPILVKEIENLRIEKETLTDSMMDKIKAKIEYKSPNYKKIEFGEKNISKTRREKIENEIAEIIIPHNLKDTRSIQSAVPLENLNNNEIFIINQENNLVKDAEILQENSQINNNPGQNLSSNVRNLFHSLSSHPNSFYDNCMQTNKESFGTFTSENQRKVEEAYNSDQRYNMKTNDNIVLKNIGSKSSLASETQRKIEEICNENKRINNEFENMTTKRGSESKSPLGGMQHVFKENASNPKLRFDMNSMESISQTILRNNNNQKSDFMNENSLKLFYNTAIDQKPRENISPGSKQTDKLQNLDERLLFINQELQNHGILNQLSDIEFEKTNTKKEDSDNHDDYLQKTIKYKKNVISE